MAVDRKIINQTLLEWLRDPACHKRAIDVIIDFVRVRARDGYYDLPVHDCPIDQAQRVVAIIEGIPLYESDFRDDADVRETVARRLTLHAKQGPTVPSLDDVFVLSSVTRLDQILSHLTGVGPWESTNGDVRLRTNGTVCYILRAEGSTKEFFAYVSLSDDRRKISIEFK